MVGWVLWQVDSVVGVMGGFYPELMRKRNRIYTIIKCGTAQYKQACD